jgi:hypothetical protein
MVHPVASAVSRSAPPLNTFWSIGDEVNCQIVSNDHRKGMGPTAAAYLASHNGLVELKSPERPVHLSHHSVDV